MIDLLIIGSGISGISAALQAEKRGIQNVLIVDARKAPGGFTAPYHHAAEFAAEKNLTEQAGRLPYPLWMQASVVGLFAAGEGKPHQAFVQTPHETKQIEAKAIVIASGAMEKPREAHRIPGTRPAGVMTPYLAMDLLARGKLPGRAILSVGDTRMHLAAVEQLRGKGCEVSSFTHGEAEIRRIFGQGRVSGALMYDIGRQREWSWSGDTLLYSEDRIPCTFFLKGTPVRRDAHYAVVTDETGRTSVPRIYAAGSCTDRGDADHLSSAGLAANNLTALWQEVFP